jgi:hypothetical protein
MMDQFKVAYIPGGMSLRHSAWWLVETAWVDGVLYQIPVLFLRRATYN